MLRWTVSLAVLVAMLVSSTELMAQRRQPLRNFARQIGARWSSGYQYQNPGWQTDYYSPWSDINTPSGQIQDGIIIENSPTNATPQQPGQIDNAASRLLRQPSQINSGIRSQQSIQQSQPPINTPYSTQTQIRPGSSIDRTISDNQRINQYLTPYHQPRATNSSIQIPNGGEFNSTPSRSINNGSWNSRYNQQFESSRPFRSGT